MRPGLEVEIDELVLVGFPPGAQARISAAVDRELARIFATKSASRRLDRVQAAETLDAGTFRPASGSGPEDIGRQVARSVYRAMQGGSK